MTKPYSSSADSPEYDSPTKLHKSAIASVQEQATKVLHKHGRISKVQFLDVWHMQRLGHICDYNGIDIRALKKNGRYEQPDESSKYALSGDDRMKQLTSNKNKVRGLVRAISE